MNILPMNVFPILYAVFAWSFVALAILFCVGVVVREFLLLAQEECRRSSYLDV